MRCVKGRDGGAGSARLNTSCGQSDLAQTRQTLAHWRRVRSRIQSSILNHTVLSRLSRSRLPPFCASALRPAALRAVGVLASLRACAYDAIMPACLLGLPKDVPALRVDDRRSVSSTSASTHRADLPTSIAIVPGNVQRQAVSYAPSWRDSLSCSILGKRHSLSRSSSLTTLADASRRLSRLPDCLSSSGPTDRFTVPTHTFAKKRLISTLKHRRRFVLPPTSAA